MHLVFESKKEGALTLEWAVEDPRFYKGGDIWAPLNSSGPDLENQGGEEFPLVKWTQWELFQGNTTCHQEFPGRSQTGSALEGDNQDSYTLSNSCELESLDSETRNPHGIWAPSNSDAPCMVKAPKQLQTELGRRWEVPQRLWEGGWVQGSVGRKRRSRTMFQDCNEWAIREHQWGDSGFWKFACRRKRRWIGGLH